MANIVIPVELLQRLAQRGWIVFATRAEAQARADALNAEARSVLGLDADTQYTAVKEHATDPNQFAVRVEDDMYPSLTPDDLTAFVNELPADWEPVMDYN